MKKTAILVGVVFFLTVTLSGAWLFPPLDQLTRTAKAQGYLDYTPDEAITLAYERCSTCHDVEKVLLYCSRCGPPFIVTIHFMKKYIDLTNLDGDHVKPLTDAEAVAITQVWNGLIGNWESDWRVQDMTKLLGKDRALIELLNTPPEERSIEVALADKFAPGSYKEQIQ
ncbi:MAG: hypothetical protein CMQ19_08515 [Gammaproteobacteria bacterium]|jgi:hypothetical protein|nr:hypothetical protein [Gammaproteobacteria bacterium]|tara:strand:- start:1145 stop:1651 length:507 start_codon:yes stop_codon:yes gene_type:complete